MRSFTLSDFDFPLPPELAANSIRNDRRLKPGSVVRVPFALMRWTELTAEVV